VQVDGPQAWNPGLIRRMDFPSKQRLEREIQDSSRQPAVFFPPQDEGQVARLMSDVFTIQGDYAGEEDLI
jgi:hypothetical protein